jgi:hypothetical protein
MKQLVVEWLEEKLLELGNQYELPEDDIDELIKKAKEIQKQQLEKVWKASEQNMRSQFSSSHYKNVTFEEYYERQSI